MVVDDVRWYPLADTHTAPHMCQLCGYMLPPPTLIQSICTMRIALARRSASSLSIRSPPGSYEPASHMTQEPSTCSSEAFSSTRRVRRKRRVVPFQATQRASGRLTTQKSSSLDIRVRSSQQKGHDPLIGAALLYKLDELIFADRMGSRLNN